MQQKVFLAWEAGRISESHLWQVRCVLELVGCCCGMPECVGHSGKARCCLDCPNSLFSSGWESNTGICCFSSLRSSFLYTPYTTFPLSVSGVGEFLVLFCLVFSVQHLDTLAFYLWLCPFHCALVKKGCLVLVITGYSTDCSMLSRCFLYS